MDLETLVKKEPLRTTVNGDAVTALIGNDDGDTYAVTQNGSLYEIGDYVQEAGTDGPLKETAKEQSRFRQTDFDLEGLAETIDRLSQRTLRKPFIPDNTVWFSHQLKDIAATYTEQKMHLTPEEFKDILATYVPRRQPVSPFADLPHQDDILVFSKRDGTTNLIPMEKSGVYTIELFAACQEKRPLPKPSDKSERKQWEVMRNASEKEQQDRIKSLFDIIVLNREVYTAEGFSRATMRRGFNNGEAYQQLYDADFVKNHASFTLRTDSNELRINLLKGEGKEGYAPATPATSNQLTTIQKPKRKKLYERVTAGFKRAKDHLRKRILPYAVAGSLLAYVIGDGIVNHPTTETVSTANTEQVTYASADTYTVNEGDCLWNIAEGMEPQMNDEQLVGKVNKIAALNGKISIGDYEARERAGRKINAEENPHLIFPRQELTLTERVTEDVKAATAEKKGNQQDGTIKDQAIKQNKAYTILPGDGTVNPYLSALEQLVSEKNATYSLSAVGASFTDAQKKQAFTDYQHYIQSGIMEGLAIARYDNRVASDSLQSAMTHAYQHSNETLTRAAERLTKEYGMHISASTLSKHGRKATGTKNRKEARTKKTA